MSRDIVTLAAFPKSGVTYLSSLLYYSLFPDSRNPNDIERRYIVDRHAHDIGKAQRYEETAFVKSHAPFACDDALLARTRRVVYVVRDPLDIMSSAYDYFFLTGDEAATTFSRFTDKWIRSGGGAFYFAGTWIEHVRSWTSQSLMPLIVVRYADLVDRPREELDRIFSFCEISPKQRDVDIAIEQSSMRAMRAREDEEFATKRNGVFYSPRFETAMAAGARFINKGYRNSHLRLTNAQRRAASRRFGQLARKVLEDEGDRDWRQAFMRLGSSSHYYS